MSNIESIDEAQDGSVERHRRLAAEHGAAPVAVITVSDTRTAETDTNGQFLHDVLAADGHAITLYKIVKDEADEIGAILDAAIDSGARVVLFNGGTGIAPRDTTYDILAKKLEKILPGFGEIFRMLSWEQVGAAAMLSRAVAGTYRGSIVFSMPGSHNAVTLAWEKLLQPEIAHLAWEVGRRGGG